MICHDDLAAQDSVIADAIAEPCFPVPEYPDDPAQWQERRFPESISVEIASSRQRAWIENLLRTLTSRRRNIPPSAKKNYDAVVSWEMDGVRCQSAAEVRLNGDVKDHISYTGDAVIASVVVRLFEENIGNAVRFKLLLPETRLGDREILAILLYREFGFLAPETRMVRGFLNGIETDYLFQESPAKEFMELNHLRESVLVEGDERWGWLMEGRPDVYKERLTRDAVWVENRSFGRADNRGWLDNPTSTAIAIAGLTTANKVYNRYQIDRPRRTGLEDHLGLSSSFRLDQNSEIIEGERLFVLLAKVLYASHGLRLHNRKFYFDPMYQHLVPIYYDGMPLGPRDNRRGLFPRHGTFPASEIDLVAEKLSDGDVRDRLYAGLLDRGGTMPRDEFEEILNAVLERTLALEPRTDMRPEEPTPTETIDLQAVLSVEENGRYQFYIYNTETTTFQLCEAVAQPGGEYSLSCWHSAMAWKDILAEPEAPNGDPIPFIGALDPSGDSGWRLTVPKAVRQSELVDPQSVDREIDEDELLIIRYSSDYEADEPPSVKVTVNSTDYESGKVMVIGDVPAGGYFEVNGKDPGAAGLTRYDTRLLTGCLTFLDATLLDATVVSNAGPCEDAVNFVRSTGRVEELVIEGPRADAIDADFSDLEFSNIRISRSANDCIDLSAGLYRISRLSVQGCGDKGASVGEKAVVIIGDLTVSNAVIGAAVKDDSYLEIGQASVDSVDLCFAAYRKKQEFGGARLFIEGKLPPMCTPQRIHIQPGSEMQIGSN